jgi:CRISPR/Cas system-associated exonuclease Cas4 (RecB family)
MSLIPAWSYSRLTVFEQCPYRAKLAFVDKIPEPERELPPGKEEHANDRGTRIHLAAEVYVKNDIELIPELENFRDELLELKTQYQEGKVSLEGEWGYDRDWNPTAWMSPNVWLRVKLDALVWLSETEALVIDYKTGKKYGNEIKHGEQANLYQLAAFMRYPDLKNITTELWYTDQDEISRMKFTREQGLRFFKHFTDRGLAVTDAKAFPPRPNIFNCKWCPYAPHASGVCEFGVSKK